MKTHHPQQVENNQKGFHGNRPPGAGMVSRATIQDNRSINETNSKLQKIMNPGPPLGSTLQAMQLLSQRPTPGRSRQLKRVDPWAEGGSRDCPIWLFDGTGAQGKAYTKTVPDKANRNAAMAETSDFIGQTPGKNGVPPGMTGPDRNKWVEDSTDLNKSMEVKVDPFCVDFKTKYDPPLQSGSSAKIDMKTTVHFGTKHQGYIVAQEEGTHSSQMEPGVSSGTVFGTTHVDTGTSTLASVAAETKASSTEPTKDAWEVRTSIMGEGARFVPIRTMNKAGTLKKDTKFYFKYTDLPYKTNAKTVGGEKYFAIEAHMIFKKWGQIFHGGYNLSKSQMVGKMKEAINKVPTTENQFVKKLGIEILNAAPSVNVFNLDA